MTTLSSRSYALLERALLIGAALAAALAVLSALHPGTSARPGATAAASQDWGRATGQP